MTSRKVFDLHLSCVYCGEWCDDDWVEVAPLITAHPGCKASSPAKPRPVHVEFWRCGRAQTGGRGWTRCQTWELCKNHGCQTLEAERLRIRCDYDGCPYPANPRYNHDHPPDRTEIVPDA
jgi:hypothetical protein